MKKQVLSPEQMQTLIDLGVDVSGASMCWVKNTDFCESEYRGRILAIHDEFCYELSCLEPIPTLDLSDILEIFPKKIKEMPLTITLFADGISHVMYKHSCGFSGRNPLEAAYQMLLWCIENNHIKTK